MLFGNKKQSKSVEESTSIEKYPPEIEAIHNEFYTASDNLVLDAAAFLEEEQSQAIQKGLKLKELGFTQAQQVMEATELQRKNRLNKSTVKNVEYFGTYYPFQKYITDEAIDAICSKYGLVYGPVTRYKGFVPQKAVEAILKFKIRPEDKIVARIKDNNSKTLLLLSANDVRFKDGYEFKTYQEGGYFYLTTDNRIYTERFALLPEDCKAFEHLEYLQFDASTYSEELGLFICAPLKDMDTTNMKLEKNRLVQHTPDPVVIYRVKGGGLILTAWGAEASDPIVVNEKIN